jgi:DNA alkylation repair enzyme
MTRRASTVAALKRELARAAKPPSLGTLAWFKTGKGEYAEHDRFIGVSVPKLRSIAAKYHSLPLAGIDALLASRTHEYRYAGLIILVARYEKGDGRTRQKIFDFYLDHTHRINNWDLVDASAPNIVGEHLADRHDFIYKAIVWTLNGIADEIGIRRHARNQIRRGLNLQMIGPEGERLVSSPACLTAM